MRRSLLALTTLSTLALPAFADQEHYVNLIQGGRPMGMGGAYTAVADDPAGLFYNPAGIVYAKSANLSASVNAFRIANKTYENVLIGNTDWSRESTGVVPNYFGMIQPFGPFSVGFSIAVTDTTEEDQAQSFNFSNNAASNVSRFTINLNQTNTVNKIGPSIAYQANDDFSIGLTLYLHLRNEKQIVNQYVEIKGDENDLNAKNVEWQNAYYKNDEVGITPKLGIMWSPNDKLTLGATLSQNYVISSDGYLQTSCLASDATQESEICDPTSLDPLQSAGKLSNSHMDDPLELSFGLAYQVSPDLLLTGDMNYYSEETGREAVVNVAMGMEYFTAPEWAVRAGFYTNMSNSPKPEINSLLEQIDYYGGSASITRFNKNSSISAGVNLQYGTGTSGAVNPNQLTDITAYDLTLFLATSYSY